MPKVPPILNNTFSNTNDNSVKSSHEFSQPDIAFNSMEVKPKPLTTYMGRRNNKKAYNSSNPYSKLLNFAFLIKF